MSDSLRQTIVADIKSAMKNKEASKLGTLRLIQSALKNKEIEMRPKELTSQDVIQVLKKMSKERKDSIEQYTKAGRQDLADKESYELKILEFYLPKPLSEEETKALVSSVIKDLQAQSMKDMAQVMKEISQRSGGSVDNKLVSQMVRAQLS